MIVLKFFLIVLGIYFAFFLLIRVFGRAIARFFLRQLNKKAQQEMDRQSREYHQYAEGYSPFEENVYVSEDVKVSIKREKKGKSMKDQTFAPDRIQQVDYEDIE